MSRGYFGIGVYMPKWEANIGTLWRHARLYGADFIFTVGARYKKQPTDTSDTPKHTPLFEYSDWQDFKAHLPKGCRIVCIEQATGAPLLPDFTHPERAVYLLGAEDKGLPKEVMFGGDSDHIIQIPSLEPQSMNVSAAGTLIMYDRFVKEATHEPDQPN